MAVLDTDANEVVIRVVYDGPPEAGKTTSLRALAGSLAQATVTPAEDVTGRTLWFDWMEYVGGRFEGVKIRCQILSVPGQRALGRRRAKLLAGADVVVSVFDSTAAGLVRSADYLRELRGQLAEVAGPPIGIVLQANKRDMPDAVALDEIRAALGGYTIGVVESVASDGTGIREAFVYAVRLALDRVRELMARGTLREGAPELRTAEELLAVLRDHERAHGDDDAPAIARVASEVDSVAASALLDVLAAERGAYARGSAPALERAPRPPDASVPSGAIWPPVEGRAILYEVAQLALAPHLLTSGDWVMGLGCGWRVVSRAGAVFDSLDEGRGALIQWARLHAASAGAVSPDRCIVIADAGDGGWRLWQIVRAQESLRDTILTAIAEETAELAVLRMCQAGKQLIEAATRVARSQCDLPCTLDTVGLVGGVPVFIGLMPPTGADAREQPPVISAQFLRAQLEPVVAVARAGDRGTALRMVLERVPRPIVDPDGIMSALVALFA